MNPDTEIRVIFDMGLILQTKFRNSKVIPLHVFYINVEAMGGRDFLELGPADLERLFKNNHFVIGGRLRLSEHLLDGLHVPGEFTVFLNLHQKYNAMNVSYHLLPTTNFVVYH
jgi:hypothetical protein